MDERRVYIKEAFRLYQLNKKQLKRLEEEIKNIAIPGASGVDYSRPVVAQGSYENFTEKQVVQFIDKHSELVEQAKAIKKKVELVRLTIAHFEIEKHAKGKKHYKYICERWLRGLSYRRAAIECEVSERTADYWIEEIYTIAEAIGEKNELF